MGVRLGKINMGFLGSAPKKLISYDIQDPSTWDFNIQDVYDTAKYYI